MVFYLIKVPRVKFAESEFLLSYIGIFLGFAFSVVTFVMTLVDKGRQRVLSTSDYSADEKKETLIRMNGLNDELSDILFFLFSSFLLIAILMLWEAIDIPYISVNANIWYSKLRILSAIKFSVFCLSVYGIYDLLIAAFKVNERVDKILECTPPAK